MRMFNLNIIAEMLFTWEGIVATIHYASSGNDLMRAAQLDYKNQEVEAHLWNCI